MSEGPALRIIWTVVPDTFSGLAQPRRGVGARVDARALRHGATFCSTPRLGDRSRACGSATPRSSSAPRRTPLAPAQGRVTCCHRERSRALGPGLARGGRDASVAWP